MIFEFQCSWYMFSCINHKIVWILSFRSKSGVGHMWSQRAWTWGDGWILRQTIEQFSYCMSENYTHETTSDTCIKPLFSFFPGCVKVLVGARCGRICYLWFGFGIFSGGKCFSDRSLILVQALFSVFPIKHFRLCWSGEESLKNLAISKKKGIIWYHFVVFNKCILNYMSGNIFLQDFVGRRDLRCSPSTKHFDSKHYAGRCGHEVHLTKVAAASFFWTSSWSCSKAAANNARRRMDQLDSKIYFLIQVYLVQFSLCRSTVST